MADPDLNLKSDFGIKYTAFLLSVHTDKIQTPGIRTQHLLYAIII